MPLLRIDDLTAYFPGLVDLPARLAPSSAIQYRRNVQLYLAWCHYDVDAARDPATLRRWRVWMVDYEELSPCTINNRLAALRTIAKLSAAYLTGDAQQQAYNFQFVEPASVPALKHRLSPTAQTWLEPDEVRMLWRAADPRTLPGLRNRALIAVLAVSGIRISEAVTLTQGQIHWKDGQGYLTVLGKRRVQEHMAPFTEEAYQWVMRWLRARARGGVEVPSVFTCFVGGGRPIPKPLTRHGGYLVIKRCAAKAGLRNVKPHDLRRFVGNRLAEDDIRQAQLALGHKDISTTTKYVRNVQRVLRMTEGLW
jgi:integrase